MIIASQSVLTLQLCQLSLIYCHCPAMPQKDSQTLCSVQSANMIIVGFDVYVEIS